MWVLLAPLTGRAAAFLEAFAYVFLYYFPYPFCQNAMKAVADSIGICVEASNEGTRNLFLGNDTGLKMKVLGRV
jgi:hypothetical protein